MIRFCRRHEDEAHELTHAWDPEVSAYTVEGWDAPGGVRDLLFPEGLDDAVTTRSRRSG